MLASSDLRIAEETETVNVPGFVQVTEARFWQKVHIGEACWPWLGARTSAGYGQLVYGRHPQKIYAHRFSYELHFGAIPHGMVICHKCDNPACVRPDHLFVGSQADNMADCSAKGRIAHGARSGSARLSEVDVLEVRRRVAAGELHRVIAADFGVARSTVSLIATGKRWAS